MRAQRRETPLRPGPGTVPALERQPRRPPVLGTATTAARLNRTTTPLNGADLAEVHAGYSRAPSQDFRILTLAGRGQEGAEHRAVSLPGRRLPAADRVAEEGERRFRAVFAPPVPVLAVHDPGLVGVQLQSDLGHSFSQGSEDPAGLLLCRALHHA